MNIFRREFSASHGMDVKGPTVALASIAAARDRSFKEKGGDLINLKFSPANVAGEQGTRRLMQVIRTWSELKHWHVQFNIINRRDAYRRAEGAGEVPRPRRAHRRLFGLFRRSLADAAGRDHRADRRGRVRAQARARGREMQVHVGANGDG